MSMNQELLLGGGIIVGLIAGLWSKIKDLAWRVCSLFIVRVQLEEDAAVAFGYWLFRRLKKSPFSERRFGALKDFVKSENRFLTIAFEALGTDNSYFWRGWRPLSVKIVMGTGSTPITSNCGWNLTVTTFRGLFDLEKVLIEAIDDLNKLRHHGESLSDKRFSVRRVSGMGSRRQRGRHYANEPDAQVGAQSNVNIRQEPNRRVLKWKLEDLGVSNEGDPWKALAYPKNVEEHVQEANRWMRSEEWYRSKSIPWRLGWLLYGLPGTGKTSLARAVAQDLDLPIMVFDLASFSNSEFSEAWEKLLNSTPCMAVLEDIDAVFNGRENRLGEEGGGLTFDCLLNCISGLAGADGVFVVVTTNKIDEIDPALGVPDGKSNSTRPGRIDRAIELGLMDREQRLKIASRILSDCPEMIKQAIDAGDSETGAQFQDRCSQLALREYWK